MALTAEEVEKLKELKRTEEFKKNYKLIKDELVKRDRQGVDMAAKGLICLFVMCYLPRRAGFPLAGILLFVLIIIPFFKSKSDIDLDDIYTEQILNLILGAILPKAKIHSWGEEPIEDVKYAGALEGEQKIDVEDVRHNENYNIYCTDEIAARKFLSPSVLA